jgi:methionine aminopeptidase
MAFYQGRLAASGLETITPHVVPGTGMKLEAGMTFTIEPMINMGGKEVKTLGDG